MNEYGNAFGPKRVCLELGVFSFGTAGLLAGGDKSADVFCLRRGQVEGKTEGEKGERPPDSGKDAADARGHWGKRGRLAGNAGLAA